MKYKTPNKKMTQWDKPDKARGNHQLTCRKPDKLREKYDSKGRKSDKSVGNDHTRYRKQGKRRKKKRGQGRAKHGSTVLVHEKNY